LSDSRLKIAVFIDFDNIEIGVKTTLGGHFDVGAVLEAIKERGEVVTKVAYGDWTRAGDYSRSLTQHAIQMVQRNLTPGGDKNGADINLALDALELAFTHNHINAFVIVGGDSDFMALVEKLKLYDRQVFVVGGRAFTSMILQKNCTEFIAYENVTGRRSSPRGGSSGKDVRDALPLVKRALKVLADREVTPQLGVLKSTLLQLDSTFSEREYGVSTFRDFVQKLERAGGVTLKGTDRSILVELRDGGTSGGGDREPDAAPAAQAAAPQAAAPQAAASTEGGVAIDMAGNEVTQAPAASSAQMTEGYAIIREVFLKPGLVTRWPLYVRQAKQLLKNADENFDERKFGFNGIIDALRFCQREGLFRLERDRQGVIRIYPGEVLQLENPAGIPAADEAPQAESGSWRHGRGATLPLDPDEALDRTIDGNRLAPGQKPAPPPPSARRRAGGRGRTAAGAADAVTPEAAEAPAAPVASEPEARTPDAVNRPDAAGDGAAAGAAQAQAHEAPAHDTPADAPASAEATDPQADEAPKAARKRAATPRKRTVKKAVKKTATP
jgi:uncharacterized LabA/DUF88 family protein